MKLLVLTRILVTLSLSVTFSACSKPLCGTAEVGSTAEGLVLRVDDSEVRRLTGETFGFNLEAVEFQLSLWDRKQRRVDPSVLAALKPFEGAIYRFPGGSIANHYRWPAGTGSPEKRKAAKVVEWTELDRIDFGMSEYLDFVDKVGGVPWYIVNLLGSFEELAPLDEMKEEGARLARLLQESGHRLLRWELGNELDRGKDLWTFDKYLHRAGEVRKAIAEAEPKARFVGMMADYDAQKSRGVTSSDYNRAVAEALAKSGVTEFQQHLYYDGPPEGPTIPNRLGQLCRSIQDARSAGVPAEGFGFWVSENARWPQSDPGKPWKEAWRKSADLGAAISVADMLIALTQIPEIRGSVLHSLHGTGGPWPLFHARGRNNTGPFAPAATLQGYSLLRQTMLPVALQTRSSSTSTSGYAGGYDGRGVVMSSVDRKQFSVWAINRRPGTLEVQLEVAALAGQRFTASLQQLSSSSQSAHNYDADVVKPRETRIDLRFDNQGTARFVLEPNSVSALSFRIEG